MIASYCITFCNAKDVKMKKNQDRSEDMPRITTTTNVYLNKERKYRMFVEMQRAIEMIPHEKGEFLMADFKDEAFMLFGENPSDPCVSVELNILQKVYDMTEEKIIEDVLVRLSKIVSEYCSVPEDHVFAFCRNAVLWTNQGVNIVGNLLDI